MRTLTLLPLSLLLHTACVETDKDASDTGSPTTPSMRMEMVSWRAMTAMTTIPPFIQARMKCVECH